MSSIAAFIITPLAATLFGAISMLWFFSDFPERRPWLRFLVLPLALLEYPVHARTINSRWFILYTTLVALLYITLFSEYRNKLYFAWLYGISYISSQLVISIFLVVEKLFIGPVYIRLSFWAFKFGLFTLVKTLDPMAKMEHIRWSQYFFALLVGALLFFCRVVQGYLENNLYAFLLYVLILLFSTFVLPLYDRLCYVDAIREEDQAIRSQINRLQEQVKSQENVARLYHDMKNSLLALQNMEDCAKRREMVFSMEKELVDYENFVKTGNETLDGLLYAKMNDIKENHIAFTFNADLSELSFLKPRQVVMLFGNALDNCVEASIKVEKEHRFIAVNSWHKAGYLVVKISNGFDGSTVRDGESFLTTKSDRTMKHGIGITSIGKAMEMVDGIVKYEISGNVFSLVLMFPLAKDSSC